MSIVAGLEIQPLHLVYMLLVLLTSTLFPMSFALLCLILELGTFGGACIDLALLLTGWVLILSSKGASVHFRSVWFLLTCVPFSVQIVYDLASLAETIPISNLLVMWFLYPTLLPTDNSGNVQPLVSCWSWASWWLTKTSECLELEILGSNELNLWPFSSEGDGVLLSNGVPRYSNNANLQDCFAIVQHFINPFTVLIALSAGFPLWWWALENVRLMPKCWQYCWNRS